MKPYVRNGALLDSQGYSSLGQRYETVDKDTPLYYKESVNGQILEEVSVIWHGQLEILWQKVLCWEPCRTHHTEREGLPASGRTQHVIASTTRPACVTTGIRIRTRQSSLKRFRACIRRMKYFLLLTLEMKITRCGNAKGHRRGHSERVYRTSASQKKGIKFIVSSASIINSAFAAREYLEKNHNVLWTSGGDKGFLELRRDALEAGAL
ncbi:hypothetical protein CHS0354_002097 [Potamilus streckersoni]|uniref:Uncharacterized protein n=1 Tax=Potamilus streckersoni TaxID=2493646 RepID=A0AAE0W7T3_9BIVA|nr:hypothetical protein CHS0354_002097 [Potamilus streckersoni]